MKKKFKKNKIVKKKLIKQSKNKSLLVFTLILSIFIIIGTVSVYSDALNITNNQTGTLSELNITTENGTIDLAKAVCSDSYYFIIKHLSTNNQLVYTDFDLDSFTGKVSSKYSILLNPKEVKPYIDDFELNCYNLVTLRLPEKKIEIKNLTVSIINFPDCLVSLNNSFFDLSIPFFKIYQGSMDCDRLDFLRWIFKLEKVDDMYAITGLKIYYFIIIIVIWLFVSLIRSEGILNKAVRRNLK